MSFSVYDMNKEMTLVCYRGVVLPKQAAFTSKKMNQLRAASSGWFLRPHLQPLSGKHEPTEKAIAMTASLTEALVRQYRVRLCGPRIYLQPSNTQGHLADALKQLAVLKDPKIKMIPPPARQLTVRITSVAEPTRKYPLAWIDMIGLGITTKSLFC